MLAIPRISSQKPLFSESKFFRQDYLVDQSRFKLEHRADKNLALPLVVDSEFYAPGVKDFLADSFSYRHPITLQVKHIHHDDGAIFVHPEFEGDPDNADKTIRHPVARHPFIIGDYLESCGHKVVIDRDDTLKQREHKPPMFLVVLYAHFALADVGMMAIDADFQTDLNRKFAYRQITMNRRMTCGMSGRVKMPWLINIDGNEYQIALKVVDTGAIHGIASYKDFCANSGIELDAKDLMKDWITRMHEAYFEVPEDFDAYALGDLHVYEALKGNSNNTRQIWQDLGVGEYFENPRLSIGSSVARIYEAKVLKYFDIDAMKAADTRGFNRQEFLEPITGKATAYFFAMMVTSNAYLLAKCDGGRCASNAPTTTTIRGELVDIDISGCYAASMSKQDMPFGVPVVYATTHKPKADRGAKLKDVLHAFESELVPGLWAMRITTKALDYELDLIPSWLDAKRTIVKKTETDIIGGELDITSGFTKMFTREITNGMLTSDLLDVIRLLNPRQTKDFIEKTEVLALAFYPKSRELDRDQFIEELENPGKRYKSRSVVMKDFEQLTQENASWCRVNLGEFFTDDIRAKRSQHAKKSALNNQYKLIANTTYGVQVSRFFRASNVIAANNITARVRAAMYMFEKSLNLVGSITDGQAFNLDNVLFRARGKYLKTEWLARMYSIAPRDFQRADGGKFGRLEIAEKTPQNVDKAAYEHCCTVWPDSTLLNAPSRKLKPIDGKVAYVDGKGVFEFEMKQFATSATIHGSSNYSFDAGANYKMRGYEKNREHQAMTLDGDTLECLDTYENTNPARVLFHEIETRPHSVRRLPPFIKTAILKPTAYARNYRNMWSMTLLQPGDNVLKIGRPSYFSVSQFKYQSFEQYNGWKKTAERLKRKFGESFEIFFTNDDGTLDYKRMIETIDKMIRDGVVAPMSVFDPHNHLNRTPPHPLVIAYHQANKLLQRKIKEAQLLDDTDDADFDLIETSDWRD